MQAKGKPIAVEHQGQLPAAALYLDLPAKVAGADVDRLYAKRSITQALIDLAAGRRIHGLGQKLAGVLALMISASSWPMFLKLCAKVVGM